MAIDTINDTNSLATLVRDIIVARQGKAFTEAEAAITWLDQDEANTEFVFGKRGDIAKQLLNQLRSEARREQGLAQLNRLYLAQLVWRLLGELFVPHKLRKQLVDDLRKQGEPSTSAQTKTLEVIAQAEEELPQKAQLAEAIVELANDAFFMADVKLFDWQEEIVSKCKANQGMRCSLNGLRATAKHLQNCERRFYGDTQRQQVESSSRGGKGGDPRKADKRERDRQIRNRMKSPKGQKPNAYGGNK